ncbi:unnamed protein product, partial [Polarella glacialis]
MGCEHPSPVQLRTIPAALAGGDVIVQAKSGTGKTIAFCSVILESIDTSRSGKAATQALCLAPTREIALQVADELRRLGWYLRPALEVACFIGGVPVEEDQERLQGEQGPPHVVVGTPGRVLKLLKEKTLVTDLRYFVLDEADKLLDCNFRQDITLITELVFNESLQFMVCSATFPPPLVKAAEELFIHVEKRTAGKRGQVDRDLPKTVFLCTSAVKKNKDGQNIDDEEVESAVLKGVLHFRHVVPGYHVRQKLPALLEILTTAAYQQAFVFVADSNAAIQIAEMLNQAGIPAAASSGRMEQSWRTQAFAGLKRFEYRVLVCTDLMSRGIDIDKVDVVVNLDLPEEKETYLHRSGRTARFGSVGWSVNLVFEGDEDEHLAFFQLQLGFEMADYADREAAIAARFQDLELGEEEREGIPGLQLTDEQTAKLPTAPYAAAPQKGSGKDKQRQREAAAPRGRKGAPAWPEEELAAVLQAALPAASTSGPPARTSASAAAAAWLQQQPQQAAQAPLQQQAQQLQPPPPFRPPPQLQQQPQLQHPPPFFAQQLQQPTHQQPLQQQPLESQDLLHQLLQSQQQPLQSQDLLQQLPRQLQPQQQPQQQPLQSQPLLQQLLRQLQPQQSSQLGSTASSMPGAAFLPLPPPVLPSAAGTSPPPREIQ